MPQFQTPEKVYLDSLPSTTFIRGTPIPLPRMIPRVGLLQIDDGEQGVVLQGVQGLVAEKLLDVVHVGAAADQLRCTAAAEGVRGDVRVKPGMARPPCTSRRNAG